MATKCRMRVGTGQNASCARRIVLRCSGDEASAFATPLLKEKKPLTATSPPVPPSNGVPSSLPVKSMTTRSPFSTFAPSPLAANGRFCSAILSSASLICASE